MNDSQTHGLYSAMVYGEDISCYAESSLWAATISQLGRVVETSGESSILNLGSVISIGYSNMGVYGLNCVIRPGGRLQHYFVNEF
jgi:hypothetical protein